MEEVQGLICEAGQLGHGVGRAMPLWLCFVYDSIYGLTNNCFSPQLQARIKSQLSSKPDLLKPASSSIGPTPLILDAEGRTVDSSGKAIQLVPRVPQFMVRFLKSACQLEVLY